MARIHSDPEAGNVKSAFVQQYLPKGEVELEERVLEDSAGQAHSVQRNVTMWNHLAPSIYHRVDVQDTHTIRDDEQVVKSWKESKYEKAYRWAAGDARADDEQE